MTNPNENALKSKITRAETLFANFVAEHNQRFNDQTMSLNYLYRIYVTVCIKITSEFFCSKKFLIKNGITHNDQLLHSGKLEISLIRPSTGWQVCSR